MSDYLIETKQLTKTYGDQAVVKNIDLHVKPGRIYGILGRNGAGKTTITNLINRFYDIADGKIHYDGISINTFRVVVYVFDNRTVIIV